MDMILIPGHSVMQRLDHRSEKEISSPPAQQPIPGMVVRLEPEVVLDRCGLHILAKASRWHRRAVMSKVRAYLRTSAPPMNVLYCDRHVHR